MYNISCFLNRFFFALLCLSSPTPCRPNKKFTSDTQKLTKKIPIFFLLLHDENDQVYRVPREMKEEKTKRLNYEKSGKNSVDKKTYNFVAKIVQFIKIK